MDFREHIERLDKMGKLVRIKSLVSKDTELMPLVRLQFRGLPEEERKAFFFGNVTDAKGKRYAIPVVVGALAASKEIFAIGIRATPETIREKLVNAQLHPIPPELVNRGVCQEEVHVGGSLKEHGGLEEFPVPISTPGFDKAPYTSFSHLITKDPDTGKVNIGNYRSQMKSPTLMGVMVHPTQHIGIHWAKCRKRGKPLQAALVIGTDPAISFAANSKIPYEAEEYAVAGGVVGEPIKVVKCKTVDIEVPDSAEIVVEGLITTEYFEPEAPFGENTGYMGYEMMNPFYEITAITHRKNPIFGGIISQFPPSESTKMRQISYESSYYAFLRYACNISGILDVAFHETGGGSRFCVIRMRKTSRSQPWQALNAAVSFDAAIGKIFIVVDEDIDPRDPDAVHWALATRMQPDRDLRIREGRTVMLDYSAIPPGIVGEGEGKLYPEPTGASALVIDATLKWDYPPVCLPEKKYMEKAIEIWKAEGLPPLKLKAPWYGYSLGFWTKENEETARWAVEGDYVRCGEKDKGRRRKVEECPRR